MNIKLFDSELKVMELIWEKEPVSAKELSLIAEKEYGWNKNTTYTVIKKIEAKGYIRRTEPGFICSSLISKEDVCKSEAKALLEKFFGGLIFAAFQRACAHRRAKRITIAFHHLQTAARAAKIFRRFAAFFAAVFVLFTAIHARAHV